MEVVANNIANAHSTRTPQGGPFRRRDVLFSAVMRPGGTTGEKMGGVQIVSIEEDTSELPRIHNPTHPDADVDGMVTMPNVTIPNEMVDMMTASRAYEANLRVLTTFREMAQQTLSLLRAS